MSRSATSAAVVPWSSGWALTPIATPAATRPSATTATPARSHRRRRFGSVADEVGLPGQLGDRGLGPLGRDGPVLRWTGGQPPGGVEGGDGRLLALLEQLATDSVPEADLVLGHRQGPQAGAQRIAAVHGDERIVVHHRQDQAPGVGQSSGDGRAIRLEGLGDRAMAEALAVHQEDRRPVLGRQLGEDPAHPVVVVRQPVSVLGDRRAAAALAREPSRASAASRRRCCRLISSRQAL